MKFQARLMGAEISDDPDSTEETAPKKPRAPRLPFTQSDTLFKHPSEYAHLSEEEKEELSERMLGVHQRAMRSSPLGKGIF